MEEASEFVLQLQRRLQNTLSEKRFLHTLGVAYLSASLAMCYGQDHQKALIAGLLHDCAKEYPQRELLERTTSSGLAVSEAERRMPFLLHGVYGAYLAEHQYGVTDRDVLNAVRNHTAGRPEMSTLEEIVFLADYLEPSRQQKTEPELDVLRQLAFRDLDAAALCVVENTIRYLKESGEDMAPITEDTHRYLLKKTSQGKGGKT